MTTTAAEALLELVLAEWAPGALLCWEEDGSLIGASDGFCRLLGLTELATERSRESAGDNGARRRAGCDPSLRLLRGAVTALGAPGHGRIEAIWTRLRGRCARDPGDLASAFATGTTLDLELAARDGSASRLVR